MKKDEHPFNWLFGKRGFLDWFFGILMIPVCAIVILLIGYILIKLGLIK